MMNTLKQHLRANAKLVKEGKPPREYPRYISTGHNPNRHQRRADEAKLRHKGNTPHGLGKRKPRNWKRKLRAS